MDKVTDKGPFGDAQRRSVPETVTGTGRWLWGPGCQYTPPSLSWQWLRCPEGCCSGRLANTAAVLPMSEPGTSGPTPPSSAGKAQAKAGPSGRGIRIPQGVLRTFRPSPLRFCSLGASFKVVESLEVVSTFLSSVSVSGSSDRRLLCLVPTYSEHHRVRGGHRRQGSGRWQGSVGPGSCQCSGVMGLGINGVGSLVGTERLSLNGPHTEWEKSQASGDSAAKTHQALATSSLNRSPRTVMMSEPGLLIGNRRLRQYSSLRVRHATECH